MDTREYPGDMIKFLQDYYGDRPLVGAEIGVLNGDHALKLLESLSIEKLFLIDPYEAYDEYHDHNKHGVIKARETAIRKLAPYCKQVEWMFMKSEEAVKHIRSKLHFVYVDGNHARPYVCNDLWGFFPLVIDDGVVGGHDYYTRKDADNLCEVEEVVNEFVELLDITLHIDGSCEAPWPDWWFMKYKGMMDRLASAPTDKKFIYTVWEEDTKFP